MLELAKIAARVAGAILRERHGQPHTIHYKGLRDITTEADLAAERAIIEIISLGCPGAKFITEESHQAHQDLSGGPVWIIDPLDGTSNFKHGLPEFSVSIGMAAGGELQVGAVYEPMTDQLFWAERSQGAFMNGTRLQVSNLGLEGAMIQQDWPRQPGPRERMLRYAQALSVPAECLRSCGSAALAFCAVAAGWAEAYIQLTLQPWDVAAGMLIIQEAGGVATSLDGVSTDLFQPDWLASNGVIHDQLVALLQAATDRPDHRASMGS
ncbi:MAG: inositol monophosphatase [Chloroflexi bacterium]|nr:inositol monophosphatase [Chloroflexota bacterium]